MAYDVNVTFIYYSSNVYTIVEKEKKLEELFICWCPWWTCLLFLLPFFCITSLSFHHYLVFSPHIQHLAISTSTYLLLFVANYV